MDSEDEGSLSSPEPLATPDLIPQPANQQERNPAPITSTSSTSPDIILVTHTSTLLNALFTGRDKDTAHNTMLLLTSHLHALTRSPTRDSPLVMFLNSTASPSSSHHSGDIAPRPSDRARQQKPPEPTLRSIFSPPPVPLEQVGRSGGQNVGFASSWRNKPSFGLVFSQMLDLHLLCSRVPRTRADAATVRASPGIVVPGVSYIWAVEVLLDEMGVYGRTADGGCDWSERRSREQRWAAVDLDGEGRVVGAVIS